MFTTMTLEGYLYVLNSVCLYSPLSMMLINIKNYSFNLKLKKLRQKIIAQEKVEVGL